MTKAAGLIFLLFDIAYSSWKFLLIVYLFVNFFFGNTTIIIMIMFMIEKWHSLIITSYYWWTHVYQVKAMALHAQLSIIVWTEDASLPAIIR